MAIPSRAPASAITQYVNVSLVDFPKLPSGALNIGGVNLKSAFLVGLNLTGANISNTNLMGAVFIGANLTGVNFSGSNMKNTNFTNANLTGQSDWRERERGDLVGGHVSRRYLQCRARWNVSRPPMTGWT